MLKLLYLGVPFVFLFSWSLNKKEFQETKVLTRNMPFQKGGRVEILNYNGDININTWTSDSLKIKVRETARAGSETEARKLLGTVEIDISTLNNGVKIMVKKFRIPYSNISVNFDIFLPPEVSIDAKSDNGDINVTGVKGKSKLVSANGDVKCEIVSLPCSHCIIHDDSFFYAFDKLPA